MSWVNEIVLACYNYSHEDENCHELGGHYSYSHITLEGENCHEFGDTTISLKKAFTGCLEFGDTTISLKKAFAGCLFLHLHRQYESCPKQFVLEHQQHHFSH